MTYCFICPLCGYKVEQGVRDPAPSCQREHDALYMRRDYPAEGVHVDRTSLR